MHLRDHIEGEILKNADASIWIFLSQTNYSYVENKWQNVLYTVIAWVLAEAMAVDNRWLWVISMAMGSGNGYGK